MGGMDFYGLHMGVILGSVSVIFIRMVITRISVGYHVIRSFT